MSCENMNNSQNEAKVVVKKNNFCVKKTECIRKLKRSEMLAYIDGLHKLLEKNKIKIRNYKDLIKKLVKEINDLKCNESKPSTVALEGCTATVKSLDDVKYEQILSEKAPSLSLVDEIRQAAEQAQCVNGFLYEPTSGLYYDQKTGYYYNAEYGLYYDGNAGRYYSYNQETNKFEFHSEVQVPATIDLKNAAAHVHAHNRNKSGDQCQSEKRVSDKGRGAKSRRKRKRERRSIRQESRTDRPEALLNSKVVENYEHAKDYDTLGHDNHVHEMEEGELLTSSDSDNDDNDDDGDDDDDDDDDDSNDGSTISSTSKSETDMENFEGSGHFQDIAKKYPPSLRIIVQESQVEGVKVGSLSLITFKGGTLGREGEHDVIIPDVNVSKFHLKFTYDADEYIYKCTDLGSRNGTILNGKRMSVCLAESVPHDLVHGSVVQIGQTKLLCHVHEGNLTCGQCEPGLLIESNKEVTAAATVSLTHKEQLKKLQRRYGLENEKFIYTKANGRYNDRAAQRRTKVGSSTDKEKTEMASVSTAISSENKGFKMLSKLGWSKGETLGKASNVEAILEPVCVTANDGKRGLGCEGGGHIDAAVAALTDQKRLVTWKKTQERYLKADIFNDENDDSS